MLEAVFDGREQAEPGWKPRIAKVLRELGRFSSHPSRNWSAREPGFQRLSLRPGIGIIGLADRPPGLWGG